MRAGRLSGHAAAVVLLGLLLLLAVLAAIMLVWHAAPTIGLQPEATARTMKAGAFDPPRPAPDFSLQGSSGSPVTLGQYRGKVVLLTFGFTYCAAVCPTTLSTLAQARKALRERADTVQVIFVTVDPDRDDAAQLRDYVTAFDPTFVGATGAPPVLADVRRKYGVTAVKEGSGSDYAMAHTSSIFLIDRVGKLRAMMPFGHEPTDFVHDIDFLLAA